ncbi:unnamed protein product [Rhizoctonia solani]|uniref:Ricin B lectin domain-containing protein n=1 Tax=Rhizoctonia solani TaxID=456999 RepID=A0A8H3D9J4_9AGAM|nr:unnamed protein product [Rhizoctonia solani]
MTISPGVYRIRNAKTNTVVDQSGSANKIIAWKQHGGANQQWFFQLSGDGVVFRSVEYGQYVYTTSMHSGGRIFPSNNLTTWNLSQDGNEWAISLPGTNYVIEIEGGSEASGASIRLSDNLGLKHQRWAFEKISDGQPQQLKQPPQQSFQQIQQPPISFLISPGIYFLRSVMSGSLVTLYGGSADEGAEISGCSDSSGNHQKWQLQPTGHGQNMTLRNVHTNTYLWFRSQSFVPSFPVNSSYKPQEYVITAANNGFYVSPAQRPGYALSLLHGSSENRTEISLWHNDQQENQKWHFDRA